MLLSFPKRVFDFYITTTSTLTETGITEEEPTEEVEEESSNDNGDGNVKGYNASA